MKLNLWKITLLALIVMGIQACGGDDPDPTPPKTAEELATEALTGTGTQAWGIAGGGKVTKGGTDVTDLYPTFELTLISTTSKSYSSQGSNDLFDANGTWSFAGSNFDKIMLSGAKPAAGREMSFTQSGNNLKLLFSIPAPGARINGQLAVAGDYVFDLIKK
jgi:hypothetical protein